MRALEERGSFSRRQDVMEVLRDELDTRDERIAQRLDARDEHIAQRLDARDEHIAQRLDAIAKAQDDINRKLAQWETGAVIIRWLAISTAGIVTSGIALTEWLRDHLK